MFSRLAHLGVPALRRARTSATGASTCARRAAARSSRATTGHGLDRDAVAGRPRSIWRWHEMMPVEEPGERRDARRGRNAAAARGAPRRDARDSRDLWIKDESANPTGSFKARGLSAAVVARRRSSAHDEDRPADRRQRRRRRRRLRREGGHGVPRLHARRHAARLPDRVRALRREGHARRRPHRRLRPDRRASARSARAGTTSRRSRSRIASRARRRWATSSPRTSAGRCPTRSSTRPAAARDSSGCGRPSTRWRSSAGSAPTRPRMVSVQAEGCAPIPKAFAEGKDVSREVRERAHVRVGPARPEGVRRLPDPAGHPRRRAATAVAVTDDAMRAGLRRDRRVGGPLRRARGRRRVGGGQGSARAEGSLDRGERVVLFNTGQRLQVPLRRYRK